MSTIFSKIWPGFALAIILLLGWLLLEKSCNKAVTTAPDASQQVMAALKAGYDSAARADSPVIEALSYRSDSLQDVIDNLTARQTIMQYTLDVMGDTVKMTLAALDQARAKHDTVPMVVNCDSLEAQVKRGIPEINGYTQLTDSIIQAAVAEATVQDSVIAKLNQLNNMASSTITAQQLQYDIIHKDDVSKTAQLKFYKPAAIGGVGLLAAIIVLKIILH
jgi:hypothetical protein